MKDRSEAQQGQKFQPDQVTEQDIREAIIRARGYIAMAARILKPPRSPDMIYQRMASSPGLRQLVKDIREERKDGAEMQLEKRIGKGDMAAIRYYLDAQARERGYGRQLVTDEQPREKEIESLTDDELRERAAGIRKRIAEAGRGTSGPEGAE